LVAPRVQPWLEQMFHSTTSAANQQQSFSSKL
jgi:hypothetical protein